MNRDKKVVIIGAIVITSVMVTGFYLYQKKHGSKPKPWGRPYADDFDDNGKLKHPTKLTEKLPPYLIEAAKNTTYGFTMSRLREEQGYGVPARQFDKKRDLVDPPRDPTPQRPKDG